nr:vegetative cell wall protein gp1-like [Penaeus vannamei]
MACVALRTCLVCPAVDGADEPSLRASTRQAFQSPGRERPPSPLPRQGPDPMVEFFRSPPIAQPTRVPSPPQETPPRRRAKGRRRRKAHRRSAHPSPGGSRWTPKPPKQKHSAEPLGSPTSSCASQREILTPPSPPLSPAGEGHPPCLPPGPSASAPPPTPAISPREMVSLLEQQAAASFPVPWAVGSAVARASTGAGCTRDCASLGGQSRSRRTTRGRTSQVKEQGQGRSKQAVHPTHA